MSETKKTFLFIVEGESDKAALEHILRSIYRKYKNIEFRVTDGDISSDENVNAFNVEDKIKGIIDSFLKDQKLKKSDIYQIAQIFDMDGAYVSDDVIVMGDTSKIVYSAQSISCSDIDKVKRRNAHKRDVMEHLLNTNNIWNIHYEMFFMSCNLDHALYNEINLDKSLKNEYADRFYESFIGKEKLFIDFLKADVVNGTPDTMATSWQYIKKNLHSLERHTNLHIFFKNNPLYDWLL